MAKVAEQIRTGSLIAGSNDYLEDNKVLMAYQAQVAAKEGMALVGYEGNPHVLAYGSA